MAALKIDRERHPVGSYSRLLDVPIIGDALSRERVSVEIERREVAGVERMVFGIDVVEFENRNLFQRVER